jgi:hypothetical protein
LVISVSAVERGAAFAGAVFPESDMAEGENEIKVIRLDLTSYTLPKEDMTSSSASGTE